MNYQQAASLLLYQSVFRNPVGDAYLTLLRSLEKSSPHAISCLEAYGNWFRLLAARHQSWLDYLVTQILLDDNPFSQQVQQVAVHELPASLVAAAKHDLQILQTLSSCPQRLSQKVQEASGLLVAPVVWEIDSSLDPWHHHDWTEALEELARHYRDRGTGIFAEYGALRWHQGRLVGIAHPDSVQIREIIGYDSQKKLLLKNTEFLLAGYPALHVLLYGSRGSGKSSLVKGLLSKYHSRGLRLIEVGKSELQYLPEIVEQLRVPQKFIIFVDDLSFEEDDDAFKALKVVLEGSLTAKAPNVVVYATSNRRHLIREYFGDRPRPQDSDEVHSWDTMQEKLSFSDRFGLTLTFESANQDTYLTIVRHLAHQALIPLSEEELEFRAKQWATCHNGRSGRSARQFINFLQAEVAHQPPSL